LAGPKGPGVIKRTLEISQHPSHLSVRLGQLHIRRHGDDGSAPLVGTVPCEDIGIVLIDHPQTTMTQQALASLVDGGAAIMVCGRDHLPAGLLLPMGQHHQVVWRVGDQLAASKPLRKQLWKQVVVAKVRAQAEHVSADAFVHRKLINLAQQVRSGDTTNIEAQAAKIYWRALRQQDPACSGFQRQSDGGDSYNAMLNYGYAVMRAAVGRAVVGAGLFPAVGIHHANRSNAFCLADDLVEPLRPLVDARVRRLVRNGFDQVNRPVKQGLLELLQIEVTTESQTGPLLVALHRYAASLVKCFRREIKQLHIPVAVRPERG
jgi:CRISPR-associated protein Cas1